MVVVVEAATLLDTMQVAVVAKVLTVRIHIVGMIILHVMHTTSYVWRRDVKKSWTTADEVKARLIDDLLVAGGLCPSEGTRFASPPRRICWS